MKILKYILFAGVLLTLYITEPIWRVQKNINSTEISQKNEKTNLIPSEANTFKKLEEEIGAKPTVHYKSRVPKPVEEYWNKTFKKSDLITKEKCSPIKASNLGWTTTCHYKINNVLKVNNYIIKNGIVINKD